jgi:hypothetical protein
LIRQKYYRNTLREKQKNEINHSSANIIWVIDRDLHTRLRYRRIYFAMRKIKIKKESRHHGTTMVEAAIVLSLLLYLTLGAIEYGWLFLKDHQITNAARNAARIAIRPDATNEQVENTINDLMVKAEIEESYYSVYFNPEDISMIPTNYPLTIRITATYCKEITSKGSSSIVGLGLFKTPFLPTPGEIEAIVTMTKEGP